jgi:hypothetical protein
LTVLIAPVALSQGVTKLVAPQPTWRIVGGQILDLRSLPFVRVPAELSYHALGYNGVPNQLITLEGFQQANPPISVTFENFPFNPGDFLPVYGMNGLVPSRALYCHALQTSNVTNRNVLGQVSSIDIVYDCGQPVTGRVLINPAQ